MRNRNAIGFAVLCLWAAMPLYGEEAAPTPAPMCRLKRLASIDIEIEDRGFIAVPVSVNGTNAWMLLHIGTPFSTITYDSAVALNLKQHNYRGDASVQIGGEKLTKIAAVESLRLGAFEVQNATLIVRMNNRAFTFGNVRGLPIIGTLAMDVFTDIDYELDLASRKLNIFSQDHCKGNVVYWTHTYTEVPYKTDVLGTVAFPIELDGHSIESTLSTGALVTSIDSGITSKVYGFDENSPGVSQTKNTVGGEDVRYRAMALSAPGINIANTEVRLRKASTRCGQEVHKTGDADAIAYANCTGVFPLSLGINVLRSLRIYVSTKEKIIYISRADAK